MSHPLIPIKRWSDGTDGNEMGLVWEYDVDVSDLCEPVVSRTSTHKIDEAAMADLARNLDKVHR
jgi:hypothetical protein